MAILTASRRAVWAAIDNWPDLAGRFRRTYRFDRTEESSNPPQPSRSIDHPQSIQDFPALSIRPAKLDKLWVTNQTTHHPYSLDCGIWTAGWDSLAESEELWEHVVDALFNATVDPHEVPEVKRVTYREPRQPSPGTFQFGRIADAGTATRFSDSGQQGIPFIMHTFGIVLTISYQPKQGS